MFERPGTERSNSRGLWSRKAETEQQSLLKAPYIQGVISHSLNEFKGRFITNNYLLS